MPPIDDVIEYAKGNAAAAKSLDEQQTWAAHHRSLVEIRQQYEQQINDCLTAFTGRHESDAKVIAALRGALETIAEPILHAEQRAKASGERLSGLAYQIYTSSENLRAMARDALKKLNEQNVGK